MGALYGDGNYFSKTSKYSTDYAAIGGSQTKCMILARVVTGVWCKGYEGLTSRDMGVHDSAVNNVNDPTIFVAFHDNSAYPEYVVRYKCQ